MTDKQMFILTMIFAAIGTWLVLLTVDMKKVRSAETAERYFAEHYISCHDCSAVVPKDMAQEVCDNLTGLRFTKGGHIIEWDKKLYCPKCRKNYDYIAPDGTKYKTIKEHYQEVK